MEIKGVLFDKDGTLLEFHQMWLKVSQGVVAALLTRYPTQVEVTATALLEAIGVYGERVDNYGLLASNPVEDTSKKWFDMLAPQCDFVAFNHEVKGLFNQQVEQMPELIQTLPGIKSTLINLKQKGFKLGIATADTKDATLYSLEQAGIIELFDFIGYSDGDIEPKPAPALMEAFCQHCDLHAAEVVMLGDTVSDMKFGINSGARSVGVLTGTASQEELASHAELVLDSVAEFTPCLLKSA
ncbi:HAD family hydrolase [Photobacterium rosenbergii]|uniref:phosphoglycolate phosphatase n=1 Tax=Photobacterium rosenbergii TaxID=294936 RepID=A0ABU3ZDM9_9GAMM|nr:HAD family hydrolase [Photobacterium rosenbergii]MDV5168190.1 HAD family hydrolase [Photobacterium rosenbergii]